MLEWKCHHGKVNSALPFNHQILWYLVAVKFNVSGCYYIYTHVQDCVYVLKLHLCKGLNLSNKNLVEILEQLICVGIPGIYTFTNCKARWELQ